MAMRWLDRDYLQGALADSVADARLRKWRDARSSVSRAESGALAVLTDAISLSDAVVDVFSLLPQDAVDMILVSGDRQRGYERLRLRYTHAEVIEDEAGTLTKFLRRGAEIVVDEMHVLGPGHYEHSFVLAGRGAFSLLFHRVDLTSTPVSPDVRNRLIGPDRAE